MKNYDEIANSVFKRRDEYVANQKRKKRIIIITVTPILCCCIVLILGFGLWENGFFSNDIPVLGSSQNESNNHNDNSSEENKSDNSNEGLSSGSTQSDDKNNSSQNKTETSSKDTTTNSSHNQSKEDTSSDNKAPESSEKTEPSENTTSGNIDDGVLKKVTSKYMSVPENMKLLGENEAREENNSKTIKAKTVLYQLDGNVVNWTTENDLIYVITSGNNRLVVINSKTMTAVSNVPLAGKPAEINLVGDKIYVSLPDLCRIDIFSKSNLAKDSSLYFEHEVSSFCIDGNYIYYSEHDQHCDVYKKNIITNELTKILPDRGFSFYQPKLYLNKQDNILYIGECGSTGSTIYYYDATTLQLKSLFRKDDYGIMNHTRDIFHVGDEIFWGNFRLSDTNAKQIVGRYGVANYGSVNYVSENLVSTFEGVFLTDTYECIINYFDAGFKFEYILVTKSDNIFFRARSIDRNIIIGVNFAMQ